MVRRFFVALVALAALVGLAIPAAAQQGAERPRPDRLDSLRLDQPSRVDGSAIGKLDPSLLGAGGEVAVSIRLTARPVALVAAADGTAAQQRAQGRRVTAEQTGFLSTARSIDPGLATLATTRSAVNAVLVEVDAAALEALAADDRVVSIARVRDYEMALSETVPYIGASAVQDLGFDGTGVKVAILDSGVDYTHAAFGGPGTVEAYEEAYGTSPEDPLNTTTDGLFPTERVVGGFDFVGEFWVGGEETPPLAPDPDPIDFEGHGTHVAHISRREQRCGPRRRPLRPQGLRLAVDRLLGRGSAPGDGLGARPRRERRHERPGRHRQHVARLAVRPGFRRRPVARRGEHHAGRDPHRRRRRQRRRQAVRPRHTGATPSALAVAQTNMPSAVLPVLQVLTPAGDCGRLHRRVPAVVGGAHGSDRRPTPIRGRGGGQPPRLRPLPSRIADRSDRPGRSG